MEATSGYGRYVQSPRRAEVDGAAFLAMCSECRKVRVAEGRWAPAEPFLDEQFGVAVSHGFCNECFQRFEDV